MARTYKQLSVVSGLSIQDILNMDAATFNKLGVADMRKVVGRLVSAGNKRLRSFDRAGENSPATRHIAKSGGRFSTKGKDLNALRAEYTRAKNFLNSRSGTRAGWKKVKKETTEALKRQGVDVSPEQFDDLWRAYEDLKELDPEVATKRLKYGILTDISNMLDDSRTDPEEIAVELHSKLDLIYEQRAELENDIDGVSGFFEL